MKKNNILLSRIDNRLIHGQIIGNWANTIGANLIVAVDDDVANNELEKSVMEMAASALGYESRFFTVKKTIEVIDKASDSQKILLVCKTPKTLRRLIEGGVVIDKVNIGNMHFVEGKTKISDKAYVSDEEMKDLEFIKSHVDEIYIQDTPVLERKDF